MGLLGDLPPHKYEEYLENKKRIREIYKNLKDSYEVQQTFDSIIESIDKLHGVNYSDNLLDGVVHSGGNVKYDRKELFIPTRSMEECEQISNGAKLMKYKNLKVNDKKK